VDFGDEFHAITLFHQQRLEVRPVSKRGGPDLCPLCNNTAGLACGATKDDGCRNATEC
jgi:hypothetical protein